MDVWAITVAAVRRWFIVLPILILTAVGAVSLGRGVAPEYEVQAIWLVVPGEGRVDNAVDVPNPYGGIDSATTALVNLLTSPSARAAVADQGLPGDFLVSTVSRTTILRFEVNADSPEAGIRTAQVVYSIASEELLTRQEEAGVREPIRYGMSTLTAPTVASVIEDGALRVQAIVGVLGVVIALVSAVAFDGLMVRLKQRKARRQAAGAADERFEASAESPATNTVTEGREGASDDGARVSDPPEDEGLDPER